MAVSNTVFAAENKNRLPLARLAVGSGRGPVGMAFELGGSLSRALADMRVLRWKSGLNAHYVYYDNVCAGFLIFADGPHISLVVVT